MGPQEAYLRRIAKDPFLKYFKPIQGPSGAVGYGRRIQVPPGAANFQDPGVTRQAADIFKQKTGNTYRGTLLPVAQDPTYKTSSIGKAEMAQAATARAKAAKEFRRTASQKTLFGGNVKDLFPSQRRDLTRRRAARRQAEKTKSILGK